MFWMDHLVLLGDNNNDGSNVTDVDEYSFPRARALVCVCVCVCVCFMLCMIWLETHPYSLCGGLASLFLFSSTLAGLWHPLPFRSSVVRSRSVLCFIFIPCYRFLHGIRSITILCTLVSKLARTASHYIWMISDQKTLQQQRSPRNKQIKCDEEKFIASTIVSILLPRFQLWLRVYGWAVPIFITCSILISKFHVIMISQ